MVLRSISTRRSLQQPSAQLATAVSTLVVATVRSRAGQRVPRSNAAQTRTSVQLEVPAAACSSRSGMHIGLDSCRWRQPLEAVAHAAASTLLTAPRRIN